MTTVPVGSQREQLKAFDHDIFGHTKSGSQHRGNAADSRLPPATVLETTVTVDGSRWPGLWSASWRSVTLPSPSMMMAHGFCFMASERRSRDQSSGRIEDSNTIAPLIAD